VYEDAAHADADANADTAFADYLHTSIVAKDVNLELIALLQLFAISKLFELGCCDNIFLIF
jgi:hypothetical protein